MLIYRKKGSSVTAGSVTSSGSIYMAVMHLLQTQPAEGGDGSHYVQSLQLVLGLLLAVILSSSAFIPSLLNFIYHLGRSQKLIP